MSNHGQDSMFACADGGSCASTFRPTLLTSRARTMAAAFAGRGFGTGEAESQVRRIVSGSGPIRKTEVFLDFGLGKKAAAFAPVALNRLL